MTHAQNKRILLFTDWYEPGFRAGGPIRSCVHFVENMKDDYEIYVFTLDRDLGDTVGYRNIASDTWVRRPEGFSIYYASPKSLSWANIRSQMAKLAPDFIYLNSMYSRYFTVYPLLMHRMAKMNARIILSPRGMLRKSAVEFKKAKKKIFLTLFRMMGLPGRIRFQATDETEEKDIRRYFGPSADITTLTNFPAMPGTLPAAVEKKPGELNLLFLGRVHPIKNLDFLLRTMKEIQARLHLTIVGGMEDRSYWQACEEIIRSLPPQITAEYVGEKPAELVRELVMENHAMALPTRGENFGHAIYEALALGKPVIISDQTPWRNLAQANAGWDLSLKDPSAFSKSLQQLADMGQDAYSQLSRGAWTFAMDFVRKQNLKEKYLKLFS